MYRTVWTLTLLLSLSSSFLLCLLLSISSLIQNVNSETSDIGRKVLYAINAGSPVVTVDSNGIVYDPDPYMHSDIGVNSDYGRRFLTIGRTASSDDAYLYQTERYGLKTFEYNIPIKTDGDYVLVLKFCEVYFLNPNRKVFSVLFNDHEVIRDLDIFEKVGHAVAHDEILPFKVTNNGKTLEVGDEKSTIAGGKIALTFLKGRKDNPKINAFYVLRGTVEDVPQLPPPEIESPYHDQDELDGEFDELSEDANFVHEDWLDEEETHENEKTHEHHISRKRKQRSIPSPPYYDPDDDRDSWSTIIPIVAAIGACLVTFLIVKYIVGKNAD